MDIDDVKGIAQIYMSMHEKADKVECPQCKGEGCDHCDNKGYHMKEDNMDPVDKKALKKKFKDRDDKDIDNDGDVDDSDEYLHKRRKAISKAESKKDFIYAAKKAKENGDKTFVFAGKTYKCEDYDDEGNLKEDKQMFVYHIRDVKQKEGNIHARSKMEAAVKARDNGFRPPMSVIMKGPYVKEEAMNEDKKSHAASPKADMIEPETDGKNAKAAADMNKKVKDQHKVDVKDRPDADKQDGSDKAKEAPKPKTLKDVRK